jgi:signal transduction histidine kinase
MAASTFTPSETVPDLSHAVSKTALGVAGMVVVPLMVLGIAVLTSMVDRLQRSLEQLRALASRLETVREEEQKRIAREIHDELGQALTAIKIELSFLLFEWPAEQKPSKRAESITKLVDQTIESVQKISTELRPGILDALGLVAAVEWAAGEFETRTGTRCRVDLPKDALKIDQERTTAIFRILQETLTNVARHADATQVDIRLAREDGSLSLEVYDNGIGISEEQLSASRSLGILGMRERTLLLGGEFLVSGAPNQGTRVRVRIPLSASLHGEQVV